MAKKKKKHCPVCDEELDEDATICPSCGILVDEPSSDQMSDEDEE